MTRFRRSSLLLVALAFGAGLWLSIGIAVAADESEGAGAPASTQDVVAWFADTAAAVTLAGQVERPIWVAIHARPTEAQQGWPHDLGAWTRVYRDARIVTASRAFVCAQRLKWVPTAEQLAQSPLHLVLAPDGRVLHQQAGWPHEAGEATVGALRAFLAEGLRRFGSIPDDAPVIDPSKVARSSDLLAKREPGRVGATAPGVRIRLRWDLPAPLWGGRDDRPLQANVQMLWDKQGPFPLGRIRMPSGKMLDMPIDVRFDDIEGLRPLVTEGRHRLDLELLPLDGSLPLGTQPIPVGTAWIEVGDGDGGGGGGGESEEPEPPPVEPPPPEPDEPSEPPPPPPPPEESRIEVVEPFADDDETVRKEDALVSVPDPTAGAEAPPPVPLEAALPELKRAVEAAVADERVSPAERAFLRRYLEALTKRLEGGK